MNVASAYLDTVVWFCIARMIAWGSEFEAPSATELPTLSRGIVLTFPLLMSAT
jgi:hypothetical protein